MKETDEKLGLVCIDPGHGGTDPGATYRNLLEKNVNLQVSILIRTLLINIGYEVVMTRMTDVFVGLPERCRIANDAKANIFVSIHCNADPDDDAPGKPEAKGEEIWFYKDSKTGWKLASCLLDEVDRIFPNEPFRGIHETDGLFVLKHTDMPAVLIELGFIDKSSSVNMFSNFSTIKNIARLISEGIDQYFH
jgi:N-acetylmuramoyl-L-alanine amidase